MSSAQAVNAVLDLLMDRVASALPGKGGPKSERLVKMFNDEPNRATIEEFIREPEVSTVYLYYDQGEKLAISLTPQMKKKGVFMLKSKNIQDVLKLDDFKADVICCEITEQTLSNLSLVAHEVFFPLLSNPANRTGWSGPTAKDVMLKFSNFLSNCTMTVGQAKGQTLLPSPPPEAFDEDNLVEKERVHLLETAVVQWANKIQVSKQLRTRFRNRLVCFFRSAVRTGELTQLLSCALCVLRSIGCSCHRSGAGDQARRAPGPRARDGVLDGQGCRSLIALRSAGFGAHEIRARDAARDEIPFRCPIREAVR